MDATQLREIFVIRRCKIIVNKKQKDNLETVLGTAGIVTSACIDNPIQKAGMDVICAIFSKATQEVHNKRLNKFLEQINDCCSNYDEAELHKLMSENILFEEDFVNCARNVVLAKSERIIRILGCIQAEHFRNKTFYNHEELFIIDGLTRMTDFDLENLDVILELFERKSKEYEEGKLLDICDIEKNNKKSILMTLSKFVQEGFIEHLTVVNSIDNIEQEDDEIYQGTLSGSFYKWSDIGHDLCKMYEKYVKTLKL